MVINMKVAFVAVNSKFSHTNLALRLIREYCKRPVHFFEFTINEPVSRAVSEIYREKPEVLCFSTYIWNVEFIVKCAKTLKTLLPDSKIIMGGPEVSYDSESFMQKNTFVDAVTVGEGESTMKELFEKNFSFAGVSGVIYRDMDKIILNKGIREPVNMDDVPFPYTDDELSDMGGKLLYYESSRGCPYNCSYCLSSTIHYLRFASVRKVESDLMRFINKNVRIVKFIDRTFNANPERAYEIFDFLIKNGKFTKFHFEISAHILTDKTLALLSSAPKGMFQFEIGVQSTNENTIKAINRKTDFKILTEAVERLMSYKNSHVHLDLIAGLPYEDLNSFKKSFNDVYALGADVLQLGFLKLLKGTQIRREYELHGYKFIDYPPYEFLENKYMSFSDTLYLKDIEEVFERYHNSGKFANTLKRLESFFETPFDMFHDIAVYFREKGYFDISVSGSTLYKIMFDFISGLGDEMICDCLKFDWYYLYHANAAPIWNGESGFAPKKRFDIIENRRKDIFAEFGNMPAKEIVKRVIFEIFDYDIFKCEKKRQLVIFFKDGGFKTMDLTAKNYEVTEISGDYATLKNTEDGSEIFIAMALLPPGTDINTHVRYENLEYTIA